MIDPVESDVGRSVIYRAHHTTEQDDPAEEGVITSFNPRYVFVCYAGKGRTSQATRREDLEWSHP